MTSYTVHYELKGRMSIDGECNVIGYASSKEMLDEMIAKHKETWRYLTWNSYRAASRLK